MSMQNANRKDDHIKMEKDTLWLDIFHTLILSHPPILLLFFQILLILQSASLSLTMRQSLAINSSKIFTLLAWKVCFLFAWESIKMTLISNFQNPYIGKINQDSEYQISLHQLWKIRKKCLINFRVSEISK